MTAALINHCKVNIRCDQSHAEQIRMNPGALCKHKPGLNTKRHARAPLASSFWREFCSLYGGGFLNRMMYRLKVNHMSVGIFGILWKTLELPVLPLFRSSFGVSRSALATWLQDDSLTISLYHHRHYTNLPGFFWIWNGMEKKKKHFKWKIVNDVRCVNMRDYR